jgi:phage baseplate assembly protein gpV
MSRMQGVATGFVKEVDTSLARVRVSMPTIDDNMESDWASVASPLAGKKRGALFMPEIGDEVLVAFGDGRFDAPYVVGYLWNGDQVSPESTSRHRVIVTPGGHQLRFEDKDPDKPLDGARIILKSDGGHSITLEDKEPKKLEIKSTAHTILLDDTQGASKISISAGDGAVTIDMETTPPSVTIANGIGTLKLDTSGVTIEAPASVTINAPGTLSINCTAATLSAATVTLDAGVLSVNSGIATFAGVVQCSALITNAVVSSTYTPGIGNLL